MQNKIIDIFTPEEIESYGERYGFVYEPDATKCKPVTIKYHWASADVVDGVIRASYRTYSPEFPEEVVKNGICLDIVFKHVHRICYFDMHDGEVSEEYKSIPGHSVHMDQRVTVFCHTRFTDGEIAARERAIKEIYQIT
jgi:hypothetical protein